jgi:hypothetical protein
MTGSFVFLRAKLGRFAGSLALLVSVPSVHSQGCVPARLLSPGWFLQASELRPHEWSMTVSYRFFHSFRDFQGAKALPVPSAPDIYANTHVHGLDLSLTYALTTRLSLTLDSPLQYGTRETFVEHGDGSAHSMRAVGLGDLRFIGNISVLDPEKHLDQNLTFSVGLKAPTAARATGASYRATGPISRPVDPSIQPGDGGWGFLLGANAFKRISRTSFAYFQGAYLVSPREMSKTETVFGDNPDFTGGDIGYILDSVPDQFLGRAGIGQTLWRSKGISALVGARIDGVPQQDLIGGSDGFRIPGYSISVDPGVSIARGRNLFMFTVPVAVKRHVSYAVADRRTNSPYGGIATLADYQITVSYSRRF